jgi:hypothetical protein
MQHKGQNAVLFGPDSGEIVNFVQIRPSGGFTSLKNPVKFPAYVDRRNLGSAVVLLFPVIVTKRHNRSGFARLGLGKILQ